MKLFIAKTFITIFLLFQVYLLIGHPSSSQALQKVLKTNVEALQLHPKNTEFLHSYLHILIAFCLSLSLLTLLSKNILPKALIILGIMLMCWLGIHPNLPPHLKLLQRCELVAIAGGLLFIGGSEYFTKTIFFEEFTSGSDETDKQKGE